MRKRESLASGSSAFSPCRSTQSEEDHLLDDPPEQQAKEGSCLR